MAAVFAVQSLAAAELSMYWGLSQWKQMGAFYISVPIGLVGLNMMGVYVSSAGHQEMYFKTDSLLGFRNHRNNGRNTQDLPLQQYLDYALYLRRSRLVQRE